MSLFDELKRRNVLRVAIAYLAAAWILIQVADIIFPRLGLSDVAITNTILVLVIGFIPAVVLSWFFELTPEGLKRDSDIESDESIAPRTTRTLDRLIIVMLVLAVGFFAVDKFVLDPVRDTLELEAATEKGRTEAVLESYGDKSIAVLAFDDMSPAQDQEYFSDGIAEELLNVLSRIGELRVISRSSAFSFKGSNATLQEIGEKLQVSYILEGSVRKSGDKIRVTAQLIDARTDTHIWSQTYDRTLDDVFVIQDEISASIVEQLKLELLNDIPAATRIDPKAFEMYLQAQFIVHSIDRPRMREAQALLDEVLAREPDYIPALNALARLYYRIPKTEGLSREQRIADIHALADRIIAIEPNGISAIVWQGWFAYVRGDLQEAAHFYEMAMSVESSNTSLLRVIVILLNTIGRPEEAIALGNYLQLRDPTCAVCIYNLAHAYELAGRYEESALVLRKVLSWHAPSEGSFWSIGRYWLFAGRPDEALAVFEQESDAGLRDMGVIMALHDLGRMDEFEERFASLRGDEPDAESIARIYAWIGNNDEAFEWLDTMIAADGPDSLRGVRGGFFEKIISDPRWRVLRDKYGYEDEPVEVIEFNYSLPPGVALD